MPTTPRPIELSATSPSADVLVCVDPAQVGTIWPHAKLLLTMAYLHHPVDDTIEAIEADVFSGASLLWIVWGPNGIIAAATTKIMQTPTRKVLRVECAAGSEMHRWLNFIKELERYGRQEGCAVCRVEGREGWSKMLTDYRQPWIVLEKVL